MYCPKCDMDFIDGVTVCSDCGSELVDKEAWMAEQSEKAGASAAEAEEKEAEMQAAIEGRLADMTEEEKEEYNERMREYAEFMEEPVTYVPEKDKYSDNKSSAVAFIAVGILLSVFAVLTWTGKVRLGIIFNIGVTVFALFLLIAGFLMLKRANSIKKIIGNEEEQRKETVNSFIAKYSAEAIENAIDTENFSEEEIVLAKLNYIQDKLTTDNDIADKAYAADLAEECYDRIFE